MAEPVAQRLDKWLVVARFARTRRRGPEGSQEHVLVSPGHEMDRKEDDQRNPDDRHQAGTESPNDLKRQAHTGTLIQFRRLSN